MNVVTDEHNQLAQHDVRILGTLPTAAISGRVWNDLDHDGLQDPGEPGIPGAVVSSSPVPFDTTTGPDGRYLLDGVDQVQDLTVMVELPPRFRYSPGNVGNDDTIDSDIQGIVGCEDDDPPCRFGAIAPFHLTEDIVLDAGAFRPDQASSPTAQPTPTPGATPPGTPPGASPPSGRPPLARTGTPTSAMLSAAGLLLLTGTALAAAAHRRHRRRIG